MLRGFFFVSKRIKMYIIHGTFMVQEFYAGFYNPLYRNFGAFLVRICYNNKNGRLPDVEQLTVFSINRSSTWQTGRHGNNVPFVCYLFIYSNSEAASLPACPNDK